VGIDDAAISSAGAILLIAFGIVRLVPNIQARVALAAGPVANWTEQRLVGSNPGGLSGQFLIGLLLGIVWTPCVGPTLGAASVLASQGDQLIYVAAVMAAFAIGSSLPLLLLGLLSREAFVRWRGRLLTVGSAGKMALGAVLVATGVLILNGIDKMVQTALLGFLPEWMLELSARY
jgi:cytochrome c biogenesis protein CcdA